MLGQKLFHYFQIKIIIYSRKILQYRCMTVSKCKLVIPNIIFSELIISDIGQVI